MKSDKEETLDTNYGSVRRNKGELLTLECIVEPEFEENSTVTNIKWEFSANDKDYEMLPSGITISNKNKISISDVDRTHRGYYRCTVNDISFTILLRVKGLCVFSIE